jgi:hypothetical protein
VAASVALCAMLQVCSRARVCVVGAQDDANVSTAFERVDLVVPAELVSLVVAIARVRGVAVVAEVVMEAHVVFLLVDAAAGVRGPLGVWRV